MKIIGVLLIITGLASIFLGGMMFGDIGLSAMMAGVIGVLSGIAVFRIPGKIKRLIADGQQPPAG